MVLCGLLAPLVSWIDQFHHLFMDVHGGGGGVNGSNALFSEGDRESVV